MNQARAAPYGARERLVSAYDANMGAIRQLFPHERGQQNLYFDEIGSGRGSGDDDGGDAPTPPAPARRCRSAVTKA